jgi:chromosome segregation ATPase
MPESESSSQISDEKREIEELKIKLTDKENQLKTLKEKLKNTQERFIEVMEAKKLCQERLNELESLNIDLKIREYMKMKEKCDQLTHRSQVTKNLLDEAREKISFQNQVIYDLKNRGILDFIIRKFPESYSEYKKQE